jgi:hypothetical protein
VQISTTGAEPDPTLETDGRAFYTIPRHVPHVLRAGPRGARALDLSSPAGFAELVLADPAHFDRLFRDVDECVSPTPAAATRVPLPG